MTRRERLARTITAAVFIAAPFVLPFELFGIGMLVIGAGLALYAAAYWHERALHYYSDNLAIGSDFSALVKRHGDLAAEHADCNPVRAELRMSTEYQAAWEKHVADALAKCEQPCPVEGRVIPVEFPQQREGGDAS